MGKGFHAAPFLIPAPPRQKLAPLGIAVLVSGWGSEAGGPGQRLPVTGPTGNRADCALNYPRQEIVVEETLNNTDREFLRLVGEGKEEEARQFAIEHITAFSEEVSDDVVASLSDESLDLDVLKQEEELMKKRKAG